MLIRSSHYEYLLKILFADLWGNPCPKFFIQVLLIDSFRKYIYLCIFNVHGFFFLHRTEAAVKKTLKIQLEGLIKCRNIQRLKVDMKLKERSLCNAIPLVQMKSQLKEIPYSGNLSVQVLDAYLYWERLMMVYVLFLEDW